MRIVTEKGKGKVKLTDKQMSAIMSALAVATLHWDELADPGVTTSKKDLIDISYYLLTAYAKSVGISEKEVRESLDKATIGYEKNQGKR